MPGPSGSKLMPVKFSRACLPYASIMTAEKTPHSHGPWQRWWLHPQRTRLRRAVFQIHLWCGLGFGLYIFFISLTGSVLVYRNELYEWLTPEIPVSAAPGPVLDDTRLQERVRAQYPGFTIVGMRRPVQARQGVDIELYDGTKLKRRYFDPVTGDDAGSASLTAYRAVTTLIHLHSDLLAGRKGRVVNGLGAMAVLLTMMTGLLIWWPGVRRWKHSLLIRPGIGGRRLVWDIHSMVGIWSAAFIGVFAMSGLYLCFPQVFHAAAEGLQPVTADNAGRRLVDDVLYWLAFSHFGRINGIGLFCEGPGACDQAVKAVWSIFGAAPAVMFATGAGMWWNRVLRRWLKFRTGS